MNEVKALALTALAIASEVEEIPESVDQSNVIPIKKATWTSPGRLAAGYSWNPLRSLPRNLPCPCGSGVKFKRCHLDKMPDAIPTKMAKEYKAALESADVINFVDDPEKPNVETFEGS